jgi:hypothetical protein
MYALLRQQGHIEEYNNLSLSSHDNRVEAYGRLTKQNLFNNSYYSRDGDYNVIQGSTSNYYGVINNIL